ncbi:MAG: serine/threonine protein kinase, partial [Myxococcota bacterium]|nr:serine/threonine protein kinase [Myxococcota bacterium]
MSELFGGKYQLKKRLGVGGMAEVWLAELKGPQGFSRQLVIKRILPHLADDDNFLSMFEDEARLAARLNHPHAVRVEEFG